MADFIETRLPFTANSTNTMFGPSFSTTILSLTNGQEKRNINWEEAIHTYSFTFNPMNPDELYTLKNIFMATKGHAKGFRVRDNADFTSKNTHTYYGQEDTISSQDQTIGTYNGTTTDFQLIKTYSFGGEDTVRVIRKPVVGTVLIYANNEYVEDTDYTVDYTTGIVTLTTIPANPTPIKAGYVFDIPVRFATNNETLAAAFDNNGELSSVAVPLREIRTS